MKTENIKIENDKKIWIFAVTTNELADILKNNGMQAYRAKQIMEWVFAKYQINPEKMSNLPKEFRNAVQDLIDFSLPPMIKQKISHDKCATKFAFTFKEDEPAVESVLMFNKKRKPTLCVSSQIGCPYKCTFCSTSSMGFVRNLTSAEMIFQVWFMRKELERRDFDLSHNIVFMGMGEPLLNREALAQSLNTFHDDSRFGISFRNMTISTSGVLDGIKWMADNYPQINLAVSLNTPVQKTRNEIMPSQCSTPIKNLMEEIRNHAAKTKRLPTIEYVLLKGVNTGRTHAISLVKLLDELDCRVNLIPYNPAENSKLKAPEMDEQKFFLDILLENRIKATLRRSSGKDIGAGCGQLATQIQQKQV
jgi:23S rRNA (adenine2503-C2)-methyltransferase